MAVLHMLSAESEPISVSEIVEKLGEEYSTRSVRRWLTELIEEGMVAKTGASRGTRYLFIEKSDRKIDSMASCFSPKSERVLQQIQKPLFDRMPKGYDEEWLESYVPNETFYLPEKIRQTLQDTGKRTKNGDPAGTYARKIYNRLLIDLSYNSSRLEGNTYSRVDTERLLLEGKEAEGKLDVEKTMILNHKEAIRYIVSHASTLEITQKTVATLHYLLSEGLVAPEFSGSVRDEGVLIGGSTYIPIENPHSLRQLLETISMKGARIEDPFELSFFLLVHLSYLQAFIDVNKRTARLCANIPLIKNNYVPLSFNDVAQSDYMSAIISIYEFQDVHPLLDLYLFSYLRTCSQYDLTVKSIIFDEIRSRYRTERRHLVGTVVRDKITGPAIDEFIKSNIPSNVEKQYQEDFIEDIMEDLRILNTDRIQGMGITEAELGAWKKAQNP